MQTSTTDRVRAAETYSNAFAALSEVLFSSVERLTALNLNVAREAFEGHCARSNEFLHLGDVGEIKCRQARAGGAAADMCTSYIHDVQAIAADSQKQISSLLGAYVATLGLGERVNANWDKGADLLSSLSRQTSGIIEDNVKAAEDVVSRMTDPDAPRPKKAA